MQVERLRRVTAKEPLERIRRSPEAPQGALGVVDKSGLILADAAGEAAARFELVAKRRQDDWDKAKVNEAVSQYLKWDQETRYDPEKGLLFTSGVGAKGLYDRSVDIYAKQSQEMAGALENDRQRAMFREAIMPHERASTVSLSKQEASELRKWNLEQSEERLKNEAVAFSGCFDTPEGRAAALAAARQVSLTVNGDQGEETNARNEKEVLRQLVSYGLDSLVRSDPLRAEKMLETYKSEFDGVTYEKMRDVVGKAVMPAKAVRLYEESGGDYAKAMSWIADNVTEGERKDFTREFQSHFSDMESVKRVTYQKTRDELAGVYLKTGGLKGVSLQALVDAGKLDADGAMLWQNRLDADRERRAAQAERAANKVFRDAYQRDQLFKLSLRGKPPIVQELMSAEYEYGKPASEFTKNYQDALERLASGDFSTDDLAHMKAYGMLVPTHEADIERKLRERQSSPQQFAIKMNYDSAFGKMLDEAGVKEVGKRTFYQDRFNYEYEGALKKEGRAPSNEAAVKLMEGILAPVVVGKERKWYGSLVNKTVRRGDIPPNAQKGADGLWYVPGEDGKFHALIFTDKGIEASRYQVVDEISR